MDRSRYRYVNFLGGRILQAREMDKLQDITRGVDDANTVTAYDLDAVYRDGATLNVNVGIASAATDRSDLGIPSLPPPCAFSRSLPPRPPNAAESPVFTPTSAYVPAARPHPYAAPARKYFPKKKILRKSPQQQPSGAETTKQTPPTLRKSPAIHGLHATINCFGI